MSNGSSWQPRLRSILLLVNLAILLLPLGSIAFLRIYDSELIRRTESELIAQGAFVGAAYREALLKAMGIDKDDAAAGLHTYGHVATFRAPRAETGYTFEPIIPELSLSKKKVLPIPKDGRKPVRSSDGQALAAGKEIGPLLDVAKQITLAGIRVLDHRGIVVATTRSELGQSLGHRAEVARALRGERVSVLRRRVSDEETPPLASIQRRSEVRVFVAMPVMDGPRVLGAVLLSRSPLSVSKALYQNRRILLGALAGILLIVLLVSILISQTIDQPIRALIERTARVSRGDRAAARPLEHPRTLEIAQLSEAFAEMASSLEARADYIRTFASHVSHEFKTPLASVRGTVELLIEHFDEMTSEEREHFLNNLDADAERLERLVRRLLEMARADNSSPAGEWVEVAPLLEQLVSRYAERGRTIALELETRTPRLNIQPEALDSIVSNLVDNAFQHGGGEVEVRIELRLTPYAESSLLQLCVRDNGSGISDSNLSRVFLPFFSTARERGGTGLGLSIVESLVRAHRGEVRLEGVDRGTSVVVELPFVR